MIAVITGDIINSEHYKVTEWLSVLKLQLSKYGNTPEHWEVYRGDEFQIKVPIAKALEVAIGIKACIKKVKGLDVRMGVGLGKESFIGASVSESNGTAYQLSGRIFEKLKDQKLSLAIATENVENDVVLNLIIKLALDFMDDWSPVSAEIITIALESPHAQQQEIADKLGVQQSAISQRQKRARLDLVQQVLAYYSSLINKK
ncbi:hypothetical protein H0I23_08960 [Cellulophaga sp. HaHaR_3_176]|uniref:SatD family protein n=1 Tax=Cellulophaga sp. HaHaR_3_176 TaxID=1942464 RepID=UPI001C1F89C1|nr:SatD family protein [Cellulophaga sp. HaHaR_3_176]QWX82601.1 hypothetical protein H0I23_08960 [Cellulophaga sp. HaHaR_3_176]